MSFFWEKDNEDCIDWEAFQKRNWPGDQVIKLLFAAGRHLEVLDIDPKLYREFKEQMGGKWTNPMLVHSPWGRTKIISTGPSFGSDRKTKPEKEE